MESFILQELYKVMLYPHTITILHLKVLGPLYTPLDNHTLSYLSHQLELASTTNHTSKTNMYFDMFSTFFPFTDEPTSRSIGGIFTKRCPGMVQHMRHVLMDGVSLVALDPAAAYKIVGFRTSSVVNK